MKLLLDTHIWLWSFLDPDKLGVRVQQELKDFDNELWLSPISTWEALTLQRKHRIELAGDLTDWFARTTSEFREAPFTHEVALASERLALTHFDPADRFLAATAYVLNLTLVTADQNLLGLGEISTLANR